MKKHLKSRNPALNITRRHEAVATDTVFSDTPAVESGVRQAQLFVGKESLVSDIYPMRSGKQFINTLEENIRRCRAMDKLISDSANPYISHKVQDILRAYTANEHWPCKCFNCDVHFGGVSYKVSSKRPVMVCENAIKMDHECSCAFCIDCFNTKISSQMKPSQRVRRPKQHRIC